MTLPRPSATRAKVTDGDAHTLDDVRAGRYRSLRAGKLACPVTLQEPATPKVGHAASGARQEASRSVVSTTSPGSSPKGFRPARPVALPGSTRGARSRSDRTRPSGNSSTTYARRPRGDRMDTLELPTEQEKLDQWRATELARRGFDEPSVELLVLSQVDLHDVDALLEHGCPHTTALLILI